MKKTMLACFGISFAVWLLIRRQSATSSISRWAISKKVGGRVDQVKGAGKSTFGKLTGNTALRAEGIVDETLGTVKHGVGRAVAAAHEAVTS